MLRNGRWRELEHGGHLTDAELAVGQHRQDAEARRVREALGGLHELVELGRIVDFVDSSCHEL